MSESAADCHPVGRRLPAPWQVTFLDVTARLLYKIYINVAQEDMSELKTMFVYGPPGRDA